MPSAISFNSEGYGIWKMPATFQSDRSCAFALRRQEPPIGSHDIATVHWKMMAADQRVQAKVNGAVYPREYPDGSKSPDEPKFPCNPAVSNCESKHFNYSLL